MDSLSQRLRIRESQLPFYLVFSQSMASIAPLSSVSAYLTVTLLTAGTSSGLATILGVLMYSTWAYIGYRFSKLYPSEGGTYTFARNIFGPRLSSAVGWIYWGSYVFYMVSTLTYLAGFLLQFYNTPPVVSKVLEVAVPSLIILIMIAGVRPPLFYGLITSVLEMLFIVVLGLQVIRLDGINLVVPPKGSVYQLLTGSIVASFTVAGGGASFFLGKEAKGKGRAVGMAYIMAFISASIIMIFSAFFLVSASKNVVGGLTNLVNTGFPGLIVAKLYLGEPFATIMFLLTVNSLIGSLIAAYVSVSRLTLSLNGISLSRSVFAVGAVFFTSAVTIALSDQFSMAYEYFLIFSLFSLFISHTLLSIGYSKLSLRNGYHIKDFLLGLVSASVMIGGLYSTYLTTGPIALLGIVVVVGLGLTGLVISSFNFTEGQGK
ncbi:APC family permease [Metallosphaera tengchongensis]|uniref:APC family permease n=1 Tax=Metallosphaera tengchongensis TaxID=1532350 RepID=A0A6N0NZ86_9CREN|nr:APC family permease [Metallosphaera tengchongensis]QKR00451.1 APC family permease [Metallosphaera tengchongensis]